uniref:Large ribosomal subunit protein uL18c n=1 Tax=Araucaria cunninghamii TaxID=56994 RepID=A0A0D6R4A2_ARACU
MALSALGSSPHSFNCNSPSPLKEFNGLHTHLLIPPLSIHFTQNHIGRLAKQMHSLKIEAVDATRRENRIARHTRIRKKLTGTTERPRLAVFRSNKHLYCQVIDDIQMQTLASASTIQKPLSQELGLTSGPTIEAAQKVGEAIAKACLEKGITKVAFDRGGFVYHGRIKALADAAREHGLDF